jgi:hypothetical protein
MTNNTPYELLVGVGTLYIAAAGVAMPAVNETPNAAYWSTPGNTEGGVKVNLTKSLEYFRDDQSKGPRKAVITEVGLEIETGLVSNTLENIGKLLGLTVTDTPPASGTIGTRKVGLHPGEVTEYAFLFRGTSAYGDFPAQYYVPRGVFDDDLEIEHTKDDKSVLPLKLVALENPLAASDDEKFGIYTMQDAAALP